MDDAKGDSLGVGSHCKDFGQYAVVGSQEAIVSDSVESRICSLAMAGGEPLIDSPVQAGWT